MKCVQCRSIEGRLKQFILMFWKHIWETQNVLFKLYRLWATISLVELRFEYFTTPPYAVSHSWFQVIVYMLHSLLKNQIIQYPFWYQKITFPILRVGVNGYVVFSTGREKYRHDGENYSSVLLQKHYNFADLSFTKLFSKYCRYHLDFRIFCAS